MKTKLLRQPHLYLVGNIGQTSYQGNFFFLKRLNGQIIAEIGGKVRWWAKEWGQVIMKRQKQLVNKDSILYINVPVLIR